MLREGLDVEGVDIKPSVQTEMQHYRGHMADVTVWEEIEKVARRVRKVNHLVIVAGGTIAEETTVTMPEIEAWDRSLKLNLSSAYYTMKAFLPVMRASEGPRTITLISSINAIRGYGVAAYSAGKAGMLGMQNALVDPLGKEGIRLNSILPGTVPTERTRNRWAHNPQHFEEMARGVPLGRLGAAEDVAEAAVVLALKLTHVHGAQLKVDGGQSASRT